jgi:TRAP transporter 4TM/12TM fusion protein
MQGMTDAELPSVLGVLRDGWHFLLPLVALVWLLVAGYSPMRVGFYAIVAVIAAASFRALLRYAAEDRSLAGLIDLGRRGVTLTLQALELGARNAVAVSMACAVAGIIVGVVGLTGLGLKFSAMMLAFSGGNLVLALLLVVIASLILGMGLPVTAAYIVLIILVGPALTEEFGIPILIAHLVVFWYSQDSNVTPPVALAGFAGAAVAGAKPMATSVQAWKFAKGLYLVPLFMVFNEAIILGGPLPVVLWNGAIAVAAIVAFAAMLEGFLWARMPLWQRALLLPAIVAVFWPEPAAEVAGVAAILAILALNRLAARPADGRPAVQGSGSVR